MATAPQMTAPLPIGRSVALALLLALCQTACGLALSGRTTLAEGLTQLSSQDGGWFSTIVEHGYRWNTYRYLHEPRYPSNICFFPAFPLAAAALQRASGLPTPVALAVTAQLACWGFWTYFLLLLRRWGVSRGVGLLGVLAVALSPGAFFLVAGYSESLFLLGMLGMMHWCRRRGPTAWTLAALHGFVMCSARFVGVALLLYPLLQAWLQGPRGAGLREWLRANWPRLVLVLVASLGTLSFFAYCQARFGRWDLYLVAQQNGWATAADYLGALRPAAYWPSWPLRNGGNFEPDRLSSWFAPLLLGMAGALLLGEWRGDGVGRRGQRIRAGLYLGAALLFYLTAAAKVGVQMSSLTRLSLPIYVLLVLAAVHRFRTAALRSPRLAVAALVLLGAAFALQLFLTYRFTRALWVA